MNPADKLASLRHAALVEVDKIDDEVLLSKGARSLAERVAEKRYLEVPRLERALLTPPRAVRKGVPGEPGREHAIVATPATRTELWLLVDGFSTLSLLAEEGALDLGDAHLDIENACVVVPYLAEHPVADVANAYFQQALEDVEVGLDRLAHDVESFNESLLPSLTEAVEGAKARAKERQRFAAALVVPQRRQAQTQRG
jgi:hypothetical protein